MEKLKVIVIVILFASCNRVTDFPVVTTGSSNSTNSSVVGVGEVVSTGGDKNVIRGFYYWPVVYGSEFNGPYPDKVIHQDEGTGEYTIDMTSYLESNKAYFYRAFAENKMGESLGEIKALIGNPKNAIVNSRGCIECDSYNVGERFYLDDKVMRVVDEDLLFDLVQLYGVDLSTICTSKLQSLKGWHLKRSTAEYLNGDITHWDVSNVKYMIETFSYLTFNQPIGNWDVSSVTDMRGLFRSTKGFNRSLENWDVSNVTDMEGMFEFCKSVPKNIGNWDVSSVTDMSDMFRQDYFSPTSSFNQNIANWNVSNVTDMEGMFERASSFNQNLSNWCVSNISSEPSDFSFGSALTASNHPVWGTCP